MSDTDNEMESFVQRVRAFGGLDRGWDSYDSHPIAKTAIEEAVALVTDLRALGAPTPIACPTYGGGIYLEWPLCSVDLSWYKDPYRDDMDNNTCHLGEDGTWVDGNVRSRDEAIAFVVDRMGSHRRDGEGA